MVVCPLPRRSVEVVVALLVVLLDLHLALPCLAQVLPKVEKVNEQRSHESD